MRNFLRSLWHGDFLASNCFAGWAVAMLLFTQAGLLAWSATRHSPTMNEPGHLVAGLSHWKFGRFEVYRVNPPLVHYVSAIPVMIAGYNEDWSGFYDSPGARPEFKMGEDFIRANGERSIWLFTIARWACIPFALIGGLFCFFWSRELWGSNLAGLISLFLWTFEPNILAHGELITPDCAATSLGLGAGYLFWRWLRKPTWGRTITAGALLGLAELTKTTWIILFGLWPLLWLFWLWTNRRNSNRWSVLNLRPSTAASSTLNQSIQLASILLLALYILNFGYGFDGSFTRLKEYTFVSDTLTKPGNTGNRFTDSWLGEAPVPVPRQYLSGVDLQKKDFEHYGQPSYLRGEWKRGGWWYYYLYGLVVKTPHGSQMMLVLAIITVLYSWRRKRHSIDSVPEIVMGIPGAHARDLVVLLAPAAVVLVLVSSQLEFNHHVRYVLPVLGFAFVFIGGTTQGLPVHLRPRIGAVYNGECSGRRDLRQFPATLEGRAKTHRATLDCLLSSGQTAAPNLGFSSSPVETAQQPSLFSRSRALLLGCPILMSASLLATMVSTLQVYPHQLAYFNEVAGGPENGYKHLLGSNLDWGQDLTLVKGWMVSRNVDPSDVLLDLEIAAYLDGPFVLEPSAAAGEFEWAIVCARHALDPSGKWCSFLPSACHSRLGATIWIFHFQSSEISPDKVRNPAFRVPRRQAQTLPASMSSIDRQPVVGDRWRLVSPLNNLTL